jgi:hypothetical protein
MKSISRRDFLKIAGVTAGAAAIAGCTPSAPAAVGGDGKTFYFGTVIRTLANEYHAAWYRGGRLFAESVPLGLATVGCTVKEIRKNRSRSCAP